jgi:uncharacterized integral membrane protein
MTQANSMESPVYQGQFGEFSITPSDRQSVIIYRSGLMVAALCFAIATVLIFWQGTTPAILTSLNILYACFCLALGVSLLTIHIYLKVLHRFLQVCWATGAVTALIVIFTRPDPFVVTVYHEAIALVGIGFTFVALTGIYFKEAFCFNRLETKLLTPLVPLLILGHLAGLLTPSMEKNLLAAWAILFLIFALRKAGQDIPADIGDKSVFAYLKEQEKAKN